MLNILGGKGFETPKHTKFHKYRVLEEFIASHLDLISKKKFKKDRVFNASEELSSGRIVTKKGFVISDKTKIVKL
jgi:hypothetical protein